MSSLKCVRAAFLGRLGISSGLSVYSLYFDRISLWTNSNEGACSVDGAFISFHPSEYACNNNDINVHHTVHLPLVALLGRSRASACRSHPRLKWVVHHGTSHSYSHRCRLPPQAKYPQSWKSRYTSSNPMLRPAAVSSEGFDDRCLRSLEVVGTSSALLRLSNWDWKRHYANSVKKTQWRKKV